MSTPTPWRIVRHSCGFCSVLSADGRMVATLHANEEAGEESIEDRALPAAEFIIRAVNAHAALVEALERAVIEQESWRNELAAIAEAFEGCAKGQFPCGCGHAAKSVRAILALAEGA